VKVLYATTNMRPAFIVDCLSDRLRWSMHLGVKWVKSDSWNRNLCGTTKRAYGLKIAT